MAISTTNKESNMSMAETTDLTAEECYAESAKALRDNNVDAGNHWRMLGDSVATTKRSQGG